ncbi:unnamed protein product, partial [Rotaria sp. Silwood2]
NQTLAKQPSLHQLSIILPQEHALIHTLKTNDINRSSAIFNTVPQSFSQVAFSHLQKVSVELDEQALTYGELLFYVQQFALLLINVYGVKEGDVVCQCVERSLSMVIGIMSIQMAGASYCPLSPRDPLQRLYSLIEETHSHIILVHQLTQNKFQFNIPMIDIDAAINTENMLNDIDLSRLTNVTMDRDSIAYVLFTSGSTGTPKAAQIRHQNFIEAIRSISEVGILSEEDTVVQMTPCSFDGHLEDIVGTLIVGGTLVMLRPHGHMDFEYLSNATDTMTVPIGSLLPGYRCAILDDFSQPVFTGQEGELFVGGVGVFAGYLGRNELTEKALVDIDGEQFYGTGDLVHFDSHGVLYYVGRKDHQVKLHGQRIELGEIERCLLQASSDVSRCVVVKHDDDHLVAYIQSNNMNEERLRQYCRSHLPPFMVPSMFIIVEQLPLNANGKLDRKRLPTPDFSWQHDVHDDDCLPYIRGGFIDCGFWSAYGPSTIHTGCST